MRRFADILFAIAALVLLSPLLLLTSLVILATSPGNAFYGAWRIGKDGRPFRMWKFRTMISGADRLGGPITSPGDSRITTVGRFLRATKIDELPQFFNLLTGDLTLVGPRPEDPKIVELYTPEQLSTLKVRPGITGPGQLYYTTDLAERIPEGVLAQEFYAHQLLGDKLRIDIEYLKRRTALSDCEVIVQTIRVIVKSLTNAIRHSSRQVVITSNRA
jgi:lipopolysaccharide/colanic/teichoic acid biosynthesis glycosyltransferase